MYFSEQQCTEPISMKWQIFHIGNWSIKADIILTLFRSWNEGAYSIWWSVNFYRIHEPGSEAREYILHWQDFAILGSFLFPFLIFFFFFSFLFYPVLWGENLWHDLCYGKGDIPAREDDLTSLSVVGDVLTTVGQDSVTRTWKQREEVEVRLPKLCLFH